MLQLDRPLVFLDLEATGPDPETARIIQVAMQRLEPTLTEVGKGIKRTDTFYALVHPDCLVPRRITELTGIGDEDVWDAPHFKDGRICDRIGDMIHDADLAGYNALAYDVPLLEAEFARIGEELPGPDDRVVVDPYLLEKALVSRKLKDVYERYTHDPLEDAHDAAADVEAAAIVLREQIDTHLNGQMPTPAELAALARGPYLDDGRKLKRENGEVVLDFGKHRGKPLGWVQYHDPGYFDWMYHNIDGLAPHIDAALD